MNNKTIYPMLLLTGVITGAITGAVAVNYLPALNFISASNSSNELMTDSGSENKSAGAEKEPLYWVAPMDANYQRDKPGLSPMGMELVPVYAEEMGDADEGPGTIKISPDVINNLGVRTETVVKKPLHTEINTVGYVQYDQDNLVHVHPRVEGWIEKLYVKAEGDPIQQGQPMYAIYSPALVNAQEEMVLALGRKNSRLIQAAKDRLRALQFPQSAISTLIKSRKVQQTVTFYSPQTGVLDNLNIREGFYVKPGTQLMSIGALDEVWVEAEVFERQASFVKSGMAVSMSLDYLPGQEWEGCIDYVYPSLDEKTRTAKVRMRFDNAEGVLKPNMFAQVTIHSESIIRSLIVPREAVIRTGKQNRVVLALDGGYFKSIEVGLGRLGDHNAEILDGLSEGDRIVTSAQFLIDSESSKTSDFIRMSHTSEQDESAMDAGTEWAEATINNVMADHRMINVDHEAIDAWGWGSMTMDFMVDESIDMKQLKEGASLRIEIQKLEGFKFKIINVEFNEMEGMSGSSTDNAPVDHSNMKMMFNSGSPSKFIDYEQHQEL